MREASYLESVTVRSRSFLVHSRCRSVQQNFRHPLLLERTDFVRQSHFQLSDRICLAKVYSFLHGRATYLERNVMFVVWHVYSWSKVSEIWSLLVDLS